MLIDATLECRFKLLRVQLSTVRAHRIVAHLDTIGVVHQAIENAIGQGSVFRDDSDRVHPGTVIAFAPDSPPNSGKVMAITQARS